MSSHHRTDRYVGSQKLSNDTTMQVINFDNSHKSRLYIDSEDRILGTYENATYSNKGNLVRQDISQIGTKKVIFDYNIPNVNELNNEFNFEISGAETPYSVFMPTGYYDNINDFMTELVNVLNASPSSAVFSYDSAAVPQTLNSTIGFKWRISNGISNNSVHGLFYFDSGFTLTQALSPTMLYTRYIDILISRVKDAQISTNTYSENKPFDNKEHIARINLPDNVGQTGISQRIETNFNIVDYFPYRRRQLTQFKISLYDEYGNFLYHETQNIEGDNYEIKYLRYNIELSLVS